MNRMLMVLFGVLSAVIALSSTAAAHEGAGAIEVVEATPGEQAITYRVRVTFVADGHGAPEATVTATPVQNGAARTPVPLQPTGEEGIYAATVPFPDAGAWTVRFTSIRPNATIERPETITAPATTAPIATATTARNDQPAGDPEEREPADGRSDASFVPLAIAGVLATGIAVLIIRRRRSLT